MLSCPDKDFVTQGQFSFLSSPMLAFLEYISSVFRDRLSAQGFDEEGDEGENVLVQDPFELRADKRGPADAIPHSYRSVRVNMHVGDRIVGGS